MVPYRTFVALGLAAGMLGAGYIFAPQTGATALSTASAPEKAAPVATATTAAEPLAAKPVSSLVTYRAPVPLAPPTHSTYFVPKTTEEAATAPSEASLNGGQPDDVTADSDGGARAKAAIELDGYKNVRALTRGADGMWHGRAMRGRTEIAVAVDASGAVSAE